ncbi:MAG: aldehyde ferredoxin oxidoreductase C-terminal domain-containing protein, partial [Sedimentisphaerales bacterium]|nr:aldehyde ferredoxin oxidoreductase C-terminal domain-containing protein [Sedimentisphaerales bacterium]
CPNCFLACGNVTTVKQGPYKGLTIEGPEYETIYALGGLNCLEKLEDVAYLNDICDRLGMDTMTAGNVTAFAIEAYKRGKIEYEVNYGQTERIAGLLKLIATREGIGELLAKGVRTASQELGLEHLAVHVKGLEPGGYDPRVLKGIGLQYAVSSRGACHMRGTFHSAEMRGLIAPDAIEGKAKLFLENENKDVLFDSFILCRFFRSFYEWDELVEVIRATTGLIMSQEDIKKTAQHITTQARLFNVREGISKKDDTLPARFFKEPLGPEGKLITEEELNTMRQEYYHLHGWNDEGIPILPV